MKAIYRISDAGYAKEKPSYIDNDQCLNNFTSIFDDVQIIADNCSEETLKMINKHVLKEQITEVSIGSGAGTFNLALDMALKYDDEEIIYFVENDYLHLRNSDKILEEAFSLGASFVTLYDHIDKYMDPNKGGNPYCAGGAEDTRVYLTKSVHWKLTNSTTMTFAAKVSTLKRVEPILRKHTTGSYPHDFDMFLELRAQNELLVSSIPAYSTHGETKWLAPLVDWSTVSAVTSPQKYFPYINKDVEE
mgnify:CR=1 FL=1